MLARMTSWMLAVAMVVGVAPAFYLLAVNATISGPSKPLVGEMQAYEVNVTAGKVRDAGQNRHGANHARYRSHVAHQPNETVEASRNLNARVGWGQSLEQQLGSIR